MTTHTSPLLTVDDTDNFITVDTGGNAYFSTNLATPLVTWPDQVIQAGTGRHGGYTATEVLGGDDVTGAQDCCWLHALNGDPSDTQAWNTATTGTDPTPAVCRTVTTSGTVPGGSNSSAFTMLHTPAIGLSGAHTTATALFASAGIWGIPFRDNTGQSGALGNPDPVADGYPADSTLVWEGDHCELASLWVADGAGESGSDPQTRYALNHDHVPLRPFGSWNDWRRGQTEEWVDLDLVRRRTDFDSEPVDLASKTWTELPSLGTFADLAQDYTSDTWDHGITWGPKEVFNVTPPTLNTTRSALGAPLVRAYLISPQYRWTWEEPNAPAPRRVIGREKDGLVGGGRRVIGGRSTRRGGNRTIGRTI